MFGFGKHKAESQAQAKQQLQLQGFNNTIRVLIDFWASAAGDDGRRSPEGIAMLMGMVDSAAQAMRVDDGNTLRLTALALIPTFPRRGDAPDIFNRMLQANRDPAMLFWVTAGGRAVHTWLTSSPDGGKVLFNALGMIAKRGEINTRLAAIPAAA